MGPNYFCWQPICRVPYDLNSFAWYVKPRSYNDVQLVIDIIMKHRITFDQYRWVKEMVLLPVYQTLGEDVSVTRADTWDYHVIASVNSRSRKTDSH